MCGPVVRHFALPAALLIFGCSFRANTPAAPPPRGASPPEAPANGEVAAAAEPAPAPPSPEPPAAEDPVDPVDDGFDEGDSVPSTSVRRMSHPLDGLDDETIERMLVDEPESLGSMSVGRPSGGRLLGGVRLPESDLYEIVDPAHAWGTEETVDYLMTAIQAVHEQYPDAPKLYVGHISAHDGGYLKPHLSHQSGRDVDISYFYKDEGEWYKRAHGGNLDVEKTWAFVRALITKTDVKLLLIDYSIQHLLRQHAEAIGEDEAWLDSIFKGGSGQRSIIRHASGHRTHLHIRFYNPVAQETARRCLPALIEHDIIEPPTYYVHHRARRGETLGKLAKRYGTTVRAIQRANGLGSTRIYAKKTYRIPQTGPAAMPSEPIRIPPRRLPPARPDKSLASEGPRR